MCSKKYGLLGGKPAVLRNCTRSFSESDGTCYASATLIIDGMTTSAAFECICSEDTCNETSRIQFTYHSLLAIVVVHAMYKFVSIEVFM